jgi:hypothetical protein
MMNCFDYNFISASGVPGLDDKAPTGTNLKFRFHDNNDPERFNAIESCYFTTALCRTA